MADHDMPDHAQHEGLTDEQADALLDMDEADEIVEHGEDATMDSGGEDDDNEDIDVEGPLEEIQLQNDSVAHFDQHTDSIFCIAQHPTRPEIVATGGGDDMAYVWDATPVDTTLEGRALSASNGTNTQSGERKGQPILAKLDGQDESVNAICFTLPTGDFIATGSLAGTLNIYTTPSVSTPCKRLASSKEVDEINWIVPCPNPAHPHMLALGAGDGSVWIYNLDPSSPSAPLTIVQTFFLHRASCTSGAWTPDGKLLATVAEDGSLYVWDVFGDAAAAGILDSTSGGGQAIVVLTAADERFKIEGGLFSVAVSPGGGIVAVGGAGGQIRIVGLPRLTVAATATVGAKGSVGVKGKAGSSTSKPSASAGQAGQILASLQAQGDGVETLDFGQPPLTILAAGSVDGSIALFDAAHNFALRRHIPSAHEDEAVIQVSFVKTKLGTVNDKGWILTSAGNDGVIRRWDVRGGVAGASGGVGEWKGHRGGGEGGGILGFVQGGGGARIVTAGDDGVALVFEGP